MPQLEKRRLTDRYISTRKPAAAGDRDVTPDADARGLALVVTDKGHRSFVLIARYPPSRNPAKRLLGEYSKSFTLEDARTKAAAWRDLIRQGIDPREEERRQREEEEKRRKAERDRRENTFEKVAEDFIERHVHNKKKPHRQAYDTERMIRRELIARWGKRPMDSITRRDVIEMVEDIADRGASAAARNALVVAKTLFKWHAGRPDNEDFNSPAAMVDATALLGKKPFRQRVLTDDEIFAFWRAAGRMRYAFGPVYRLLLLTGCRLNEIAAARWPEFHPELVRLIKRHEDNDEAIEWAKVSDEIKLLTVPPERFKSDVTHLVPLTDMSCAIVESLPRFRGEHAFSTTAGKKPLGGFSKAKTRLNREMLRTLKAMARRRGEDPARVELEPFDMRDVRRTVRTRLSKLKVEPHVAELIIGHGKRGLVKIYDQHDHFDEMRDGVSRWASNLRSIVSPPPENVVEFETARAVQ